MPLRVFLDQLTDHEVPRGLDKSQLYDSNIASVDNPLAEPRVLRVTKWWRGESRSCVEHTF